MPGVPVGAGWCRFGAGVCRMVPVVPVGAGSAGSCRFCAGWCRLVPVKPYDVSILTCFYE